MAKLEAAAQPLETARSDAPTATIETDHLTSLGTTVGTAAYMSPERARAIENLRIQNAAYGVSEVARSWRVPAISF